MLAGTNPDYAIQDLYDAIASGNPVGDHKDVLHDNYVNCCSHPGLCTFK